MARTYPPSSLTAKQTAKILALVTADIEATRTSLPIPELNEAMDLYNIVNGMNEKALHADDPKVKLVKAQKPTPSGKNGE